MNIHAKYTKKYVDKDEHGNVILWEPDTLNFVITGPEITQLKVLLNRALNCLPPHDPQWKDWFDLADKLEGRT